MQTPNYRDFYQKALIPIGLKDMIALKETGTDQIETPTTHWLIGIQGELLLQPKEYYFWKVSIYPSNSEGTFIWNKPFFCSHLMESMDSAIELAKKFVIYSKKDELGASNNLEA